MPLDDALGRLMERILSAGEPGQAEQAFVEAAQRGGEAIGPLLDLRTELVFGPLRGLTVDRFDALLIEHFGASAVPALIEILSRKQRGHHAATLLRRYGAEVVPPLLDALRSSDDSQDARRRSAAAVMVLAAFPQQAAPGLIQLLRHERSWASAVLGLAQIGPEVAPVLMQHLEMDIADGVGAVIVELGAEAYPLLLDTLSTDQAHAAVYAMLRVGAPIAPQLVELLCDPVRGRFAYAALVQMGAEAVEALIEGLESSRENQRYMVAVTLGRIGPEADRSIPALTDLAIGDPNDLVREAAGEALEVIREA